MRCSCSFWTSFWENLAKSTLFKATEAVNNFEDGREEKSDSVSDLGRKKFSWPLQWIEVLFWMSLVNVERRVVPVFINSWRVRLGANKLVSSICRVVSLLSRRVRCAVSFCLF